MKIKYGAEVLDRNGNLLGTVDHLMRNTVTGEIKKFIVNRKAPLRDIFLSPEDVLETRSNKIKVNVSPDESSSHS
jgi:hypothetical protein